MTTGLKIPDTSSSASVKWIAEIFPFEVDEPSEATPIAPTIAPETPPDTAPYWLGAGGDSTGVDYNPNPLYQAGYRSTLELVSDKVDVALGVNSITVSRDKSKPDAESRFSLVGPVPRAIVPGNWVVLTSMQKKASNLEPLVRFVGQIEHLDIDYKTTGEGTLVQETTVVLREWSTVLTTRFRYDRNSLAERVSQLSPAAFATAVGNFVASQTGVNSQDRVKQLLDMAKASFDPFEVAHVTLLLMGMISQADALSKSKENADKEFFLLSQRPPKVPAKLLTRLNISGSAAGSALDAVNALSGIATPGSESLGENEAESPFARGFMKVVTGIKADDSLSKGDWNGIFPEDLKIDAFAATMRENYEVDRTFKKRANAMFLNSTLSKKSAWELIVGNIEPGFNEVYTDMWYERSAVSNDQSITASIKSQPVLVMRDKPFALRQIVSEEPFVSDYQNPDIRTNIEEEFSVYDDLPRLVIGSEFVMQFKLRHDFLTSPNYILPEFQVPALGKNLSGSISSVVSRVTLKNQMERFGGQEKFFELNFVGIEDDQTADSPTLEDYLKAATDVNRIWFSYLYRMPSASLVIKDNNFPLSVGFNLQFQVGFFTLVGHIESVSTTYQIDAEGAEQTVSSISLSRLVYWPTGYQNGGDNSLRLMPMHGWGRLFDATFAQAQNDITSPRGQADQDALNAAANRLDPLGFGNQPLPNNPFA